MERHNKGCAVMDLSPRFHFRSLFERHEQTESAQEKQHIRDRLRMERRATVLASITCHLSGDRNGASWHWDHYMEATKVLHKLTQDPRYKTTNRIHRK